MIRSLTIIENKDENEKGITYSLNGDLPIDEAARALVIVAFNAKKHEQKQEEKKD